MNKLMMALGVIAIAVSAPAAVNTNKVTSVLDLPPGSILSANTHYIFGDGNNAGKMEIDASSRPGMSALKVPVGASVIIEIKDKFTLTLKGGRG